MSTIFGIIVLLCFFGFVCFIPYYGIVIPLKQSKEKKMFKKMIANPCDSTVLTYIKAFNATYGFASTMYNSQFAVNHRNDQLRQASGWDVVKESDKVSEDVKAQLKTAYLSNGVPVK